MAHISPYEINSQILDLIGKLEEEFSQNTEKEILSKLNRIDSYPNMSRYQLSLTKKRLGDCYMKYDITGNALEIYKLALKDNKNLPIKRIIKKLSECPHDALTYSSDIHYMEDADIINHTRPATLEYDPEYEEKLSDAISKLGDDYKKSFYELRKTHDFYSSMPDDGLHPSASPKRDRSRLAALTGLSEQELENIIQGTINDVNEQYEKNWDQITARDMASSKKFQSKHEAALEPARNLIVNADSPVPANLSAISFSESDLLFIKYLHHKSISLDNIPGYFTHEHHINYCKVIQAAFSEGLLSYAPASFTLSKMTVADLKIFLNQNGITPSGKKADLINTILSSLNTDYFNQKYYELTPKGIEKTGYVDLYHKEDK